MSRYDSRSADPSSYRDHQSDSGFGGALGYGSSVRSSPSKRDYYVAEPPRKLDLDGLTPFEKNFYVESPSVAAMSEKEMEDRRSIDYKGKSQLKAEMFPNLSRVSAMWGFLALDNYSRISCCNLPAYDRLTKLLLLRAKSVRWNLT
ncbi:hypothetical protein Q3G72_001127 [Acer saccharum]|nr:hypothetical protein Q3G72_001127 [Acer saccharum]